MKARAMRKSLQPKGEKVIKVPKSKKVRKANVSADTNSETK
jgi:hypothetical protein